MTRLGGVVGLVGLVGLVGVGALAWPASGCSSAPSKRATTGQDPVASEDEATRLAHLLGELQDDILTSYDRDELPELDSGMIDARVGTARIGAGPDDILTGEELRTAATRPAAQARTASRWPLDVDRSMRNYVRSKRLEIRLAADQTAAWMSDELSWRIKMCDGTVDRTAVIPLRITALYAHDGDRWVPVFEHLSFGWAPAPRDGPRPRPIKTAVVSGDLKDELSGIVLRGLFRAPRDPEIVAQDPSALVLGPDAGDEWHGPHVLEAQLYAGKLEDRRVGIVGRSLGDATIAYWVGDYIAEVPARPGVAAGKVAMRVTYVFEKRRAAGGGSCAKDPATGTPADCRWMLVQSHMSQPISDAELAGRVFGEALISAEPLALDCSDGARPTAPAAALRRAASPPAAQTP